MLDRQGLSQFIWQLLPGQCLLCGLASHRNNELCAVCESDLYQPPERCRRCGASQPPGPISRPPPCLTCQQWRPPWQQLQAACDYQEPADVLVQMLKFQRQRAAARVMAQLMQTRLPADQWRHLDQPALVPIPLHPRRLWRRGFNQSELIAAHLSRLTGLPVLRRAIRRRRHTRAQARLSRAARLGNLAGAFQGQSSRLAGHDCILIDDVLTTGATLHAVATEALAAGAASTQVWVFSRTPAVVV